MKAELAKAAESARKAIEFQQSSALAIAISHMNMPKVPFDFNYKGVSFNCIATFEGERLFEIELRHEKLTGRISFNKR